MKYCILCNKVLEIKPIGRKNNKYCSLKCKRNYNLLINPEKIRKYQRDNHYKYKEKRKAYRKQWGLNNPGYQKEWQKVNTDHIKQYSRIYRKKNQQTINEKDRLRRKKNPLYKMAVYLRIRTRRLVKTKGFKKKYKFEEYIGCSKVELKVYIEQKFKSGMSWENYGQWHIDHIIPLVSAKTIDDLYKLCHYTNLQPLWAKENLKKHDKIL